MNTTQTQQPTRSGQFVRDIRTGKLGITTEAPRARKPIIGVMYQGAAYSVLSQLADLVTIELVEPAAEANDMFTHAPDTCWACDHGRRVAAGTR